MVLLIAGVLAAVAVPRMTDRSAIQSRGAASDVRTALRYAQRLAMAKNLQVCVTTSAVPDLTLRFASIADGVCDQPVARPEEGTNYVVTVPPGIALTSSVPSFRFDGQGRPITTPPNTVLTAPVNVTVGNTLPIVVQPQTGYVQ